MIVYKVCTSVCSIHNSINYLRETDTFTLLLSQLSFYLLFNTRNIFFHFALYHNKVIPIAHQ